MIESKYNVSFPHALKIWNYLNSIRKRRLNFLKAKGQMSNKC